MQVTRSVTGRTKADLSVYKSALAVPQDAMVNQRVPRTLLLEHGAVTSADRRRIREGVEEVRWIAALKPTTIGVPEYRDEVREYLEIAVLRIHLREGAEVNRLVELLHRATPYPAFVLAEGPFGLEMSVAHKRASLAERGVSVLDGKLRTVRPEDTDASEVLADFTRALAVTRQPEAHLYALYDGWFDVFTALEVARLSGKFARAESLEEARALREILDEYRDLEAKLRKLSRAAGSERQMARRVELNLEVNQLRTMLDTMRSRL
jgi:hypothetical protein